MSSDMKHTPGPWSLIEVEGKFCPAGGGGLSILTIVDEDGTNFAAVFEPADAHLIAAAPDMLAALHQARGWLESWASAEGQLAVINAAIAKAEGAA